MFSILITLQIAAIIAAVFLIFVIATMPPDARHKPLHPLCLALTAVCALGITCMLGVSIDGFFALVHEARLRGA